jgi:hypothetical protein
LCAGDLAWLICALLALLMSARAVMVLLLSLLHNMYGQERLALKDMVIVW